LLIGEQQVDKSETAAPYDVGVIGLGYVGLTLATAMADVGLRVIGIERRPDVVAMTNRGEPHFEEIGLRDVLGRVVADGHLVAREEFDAGDRCDAFVITVGTPLSSEGKARLDMIEHATDQVAQRLEDEALVILRSTVMIGTTRNVVAPILQRTGKRFHLAMCPERTLEGKAMTELRHLPQIVGADDDETRDLAGRLFTRLTPTVLRASSLETAEIIKLVDNTYRDVWFGFANEVARVCDAVGVSAHEVVSSGKLGYPRTNVAMPGLVGGPCLEKDPHILCQSAAKFGIGLDITAAARRVNERQPVETVDFMSAELERRGIAAKPVIAMLGLAFKGVPETDDLRGAMSLHVLEALKVRFPDAEFRAYDPVIAFDALDRIDERMRACNNLKDAVSGAHLAVITNNHPVFAKRDFNALAGHLAQDGFFYDYWNHFSGAQHVDFHDRYFAVGNTRRTAS
jgi:UDP-N-acetyl-D-mannosaminuronic acid dehydrogenase